MDTLATTDRERNTENQNAAALESFTAYCNENPSMRFWQALRNWSGFHFILASNDPKADACPNVVDTFYFEGMRGMERETE